MLTAVSPLHVAAYIRTHPGSAPTVKQHLAAIRMLGDWLVVSQVLPVNPAAAVRGPKHRCLHGSFMTGQTCFCFAVQIVDIQGLAIRPKRVRLELGAHTAEPFLMISHDLRNPLRSFQLFERFSLAPGKRRAVFDGVLLVSLGFLERLWVLLFEPYPFDLLRRGCCGRLRMLWFTPRQ